MKVVIRLYGALRRHRPAGAGGEPHHPFEIDLPPGVTVDVLTQRLGIPDGYVSAAAVNDEAVESSAVLTEGDRVSLFPPSAGGAITVRRRLLRSHP